MFLEDSIDGESKPEPRPALASWARHLVYFQLILVIPTILIGRCEVWGYPQVLTLLAPMFWVCNLSMFVFPLVAFVRMKTPWPPERGAIAAFLLCMSLSFVQLLAILPLVQ